MFLPLVSKMLHSGMNRWVKMAEQVNFSPAVARRLRTVQWIRLWPHQKRSEALRETLQYLG